MPPFEHAHRASGYTEATSSDYDAIRPVSSLSSTPPASASLKSRYISDRGGGSDGYSDGASGAASSSVRPLEPLVRVEEDAGPIAAMPQQEIESIPPQYHSISN